VHLLDWWNNKPQHDANGAYGITCYLRCRTCSS
jgi:hypothetical protein